MTCLSDRQKHSQMVIEFVNRQKHGQMVIEQMNRQKFSQMVIDCYSDRL